MPKYEQLDLFTGEAIAIVSPPTKKERIAKSVRLAFAVQMSIAKLDNLRDTMKLVGELCETLTGINYPFNDEAGQRRYERKTAKSIATDLKRKRGRPKKQQRKGASEAQHAELKRSLQKRRPEEYDNRIN